MATPKTDKPAAKPAAKSTDKATKGDKAAKGAGKTVAVAAGAADAVASARLQQIYREKIVPELMAKFGFTSVMQVPRLQKITLNMGVSEEIGRAHV